MGEFKISEAHGVILLEKDNNGVAIMRTRDGDVYFSTSKDEFEFELCFFSRNYEEFQTYSVFENLLKALIGRYILYDYQEEYSMLPKDFIDLGNKTITWHSDGGTNNVLRMKYDERTIKISISKSKNSIKTETNAIRIRTSGSDYENYYQEFISFFRQLTDLEHRLNPKILNQQEEKCK